MPAAETYHRNLPQMPTAETVPVHRLVSERETAGRILPAQSPSGASDTLPIRESREAGTPFSVLPPLKSSAFLRSFPSADLTPFKVKRQMEIGRRILNQMEAPVVLDFRRFGNLIKVAVHLCVFIQLFHAAFLFQIRFRNQE